MPNIIYVSAEELEESGVLFDAKCDSIYETGRWHNYHEAVIPWNDSYYTVCYKRGATEYQDKGIEFFADPVQLLEVAYREVKKMEWVPV